ncbi:excinuclease ABC subunit A [Chlamydia ibidis]|uniref:UvrABC system protein A n=3 Tax=Chlamydia ibidis TaxID=1405396 RepID=S7J329_9CHLA|nr:excinuclease ABC subunit A [Chlamydia ibidis]EQM62300.1 excinuclease ABC subunit A [Chlamydia ibidis 10-1398/6]
MSPVVISGINVRNLKNVSIEFLSGEIVLLTGVSGSGKSSLAFDTIYAAGRKRYIATLPSFFANITGTLPTPDVQEIRGLSPTIAVKQNYFTQHAHATVGSATEIFKHLALLFSLEAEARDPETKQILNLQSKEKILAILEDIPDGSQLLLLSPISSGDQKNVQELIKQGFTKIRINNETVPIYSFLSSGIENYYEAQVVVDSFVKNDKNSARLKLSALTALELGKGHCFAMINGGESLSFSTEIRSSTSQEKFTPLTPDLFSPSSIHGRCLQCQGSGLYITIDDSNLINRDLSIQQNCCSLARSSLSVVYHGIYQALADTLDFDLDTPWKDLSENIQNIFLYGGNNLILPVYLFDPSLGKKKLSHKLWRGILNDIGEKARYAADPQRHIPKGTSCNICQKCSGTGINSFALSATWHGKTFADFYHLSLGDLHTFVSSIKTYSSFVKEVLDGLTSRLSCLIDLGLSYLTPGRAVATLSGGEQERTALAQHLGSGLLGITYILDEPSIGLHPRDTQKLIEIIQRLRDQGNTVILVEHDEQMISFVDRVIDIGPGAGIFGGQVLFNGSPKQFLETSNTITSRYLRNEEKIALPKRREPPKGFLSLSGATIHNLKNISIQLPLERISAITGVSGSGKSSLINNTLVPAMQDFLDGNTTSKLSITGGDIERIVHITRDLPGRSQRSTPITYIKALDDIRELFANQTRSRHLGFTKKHFSFNLPQGACSECQGLGSSTISEDLSPLPCSVCHGKRFQSQVLEVTYQGKNISDILEMTAHEAEQFFQICPKIHEKIHTLCLLGLGHLPLGRPLSSLSGGEIQRLKLAFELLIPTQKPTLYVLDEPTTGLHTHDIKSLITILLSMTMQKHTVVIIEHNMHVIKIADHIVELGPEGGDRGGYLLASCSPEDLVNLSTPTALALRPYIQDNSSSIILSPKTPVKSSPKSITIRDAHHNNLKHIDLSIPRNCLTTVVGPSASGKYSLVFNVLYSYGNIAYAELFPTYLRQTLINKTPLPLVKDVRGLSPVISIKKTNPGKNSRHSVASALGISNSLEKLFATYGHPHIPETKEPLHKITLESIVETLLKNYENNYITITTPIELENDREFLLDTKRKEGFVKLYANGTIYDLDGPLPKKLINPAIIIQHTKITRGKASTLLSSLAIAFSASSCPILYLNVSGDPISLCYTLGWSDADGNSYPQITRKTLSPEHEEGRCPQCNGTGSIDTISLESHKSKISNYTPIELWQLFFPNSSTKDLENLLSFLGIDLSTKICDLDPKQFSILCKGKKHAKGLDHLLTQQHYCLTSSQILDSLVLPISCPLCHGFGIHPYGQNVLINGVSIIDIYKNDSQYLKTFLSSLNREYVHDLLEQLALLERVGLEYITLGQRQDSLSDGEAYRLHIAKKISTNLRDIVYLLEDPISGLHPKDQTCLIHLLRDLVESNNTVIATDRNDLLHAYTDNTIYLGPGSGPDGGSIVSALPHIDTHIPCSSISKQNLLKIEVSAHNLINLKVSIPLGSLVAIGGVSGSGKTSLLTEGIYKHAEHYLNLKGMEKEFQKILFLDSYPIVTSIRSDISTYFSIAPALREFYASLTQAKALQISPSMLSPNTKQGQCSDCLGLGYRMIDRAFYALEKQVCSVCSGFRLNPLSQEVKYEGKHFGQLLQTSIADIHSMFPFIKKIQAPINALIKARLDYLTLGQNLSSLSRSEKIAIKIAKHLYLSPKEPTLFLLDELSSSLDNLRKEELIHLLRHLVTLGHSVVYIDHDRNMLKHADYFIELGPGSGRNGGKIIFSGHPKDSKLSPTSIWKDFL